MSMGLPAYTSVGSGTKTSNAASALATVTPNASTLAGDLVVAVCYGTGAGGDLTIARDAGDGWVILDSGWDGTNNFGIFLAACIATRSGSSGYSGITLPASMPWTLQCHTFRIKAPAAFLLGRCQSIGWFNDTVASTSLNAPAINQPYPQGIDLVGRGYNNAAITTTVGNITNYTERFDTGQVGPPHGVVLNDRTAVITGSVQNGSLTSALAVLKPFRAGVRAFIPIIGNTLMPGRMQGNRRLLG
jgi:hypothetical protein